jgi:hypothetical protein
MCSLKTNLGIKRCLFIKVFREKSWLLIRFLIEHVVVTYIRKLGIDRDTTI